jgi:hypothetical protein
MSVTISSGGGGGGITIENDPTALKIASNLTDLADPNQAIVNLGIVPEAPLDGTVYGRQSGLWVAAGGGGGRNYAAEAANALACATQYGSAFYGYDEVNGSFISARWVGAEDGVLSAIVTNAYAFVPAPLLFTYVNYIGYAFEYGISSTWGGVLGTDVIDLFDQYGWIVNNVSGYNGGQMHMYASIDYGTTKELSFAPVYDFV